MRSRGAKIELSGMMGSLSKRPFVLVLEGAGTASSNKWPTAHESK
jgi:hypothetical protein